MKDAEQEWQSIQDELERRKTKKKDSDEFKVVEGVIDPPTLKVLYRLLNKGVLNAVYGAISTGKEAGVYRGEDPDGKPLAVKIYRVSTAETHYMREYMISDPRFSRVSRRSRTLIPQWAAKEFKNLKRYHEAGVNVPQPIAVDKNVLVMEFIGDEESKLPAPLLKDVELESPVETFNEIIGMIETGYTEAELVHADLSEFNILWLEKLYFIDVSQAVLKAHDYAEKYLYRDIQNITSYFNKLDVETADPQDITDYILSLGEE